MLCRRRSLRRTPVALICRSRTASWVSSPPNPDLDLPDANPDGLDTENQDFDVNIPPVDMVDAGTLPATWLAHLCVRRRRRWTPGRWATG